MFSQIELCLRNSKNLFVYFFSVFKLDSAANSTYCMPESTDDKVFNQACQGKKLDEQPLVLHKIARA